MLKINLQSNQNIFFTSDTHAFHLNICSATTKWCEDNDGKTTRQFESIDHMNDTLINNINNVIKDDDTLLHLGDWSFNGFERIAEFRNRLICKNIYIVLGNHDHHIGNNKDNIQSLFSSVSVGNLELEVTYRSYIRKEIAEKQRFFLNHYPVCSWKDMNKGVIHLFGHVHLPYPSNLMKGKAMDVGVDGNNYEPYSLSKILHIMKDQPISHISLPYDHHSKERK